MDPALAEFYVEPFDDCAVKQHHHRHPAQTEIHVGITDQRSVDRPSGIVADESNQGLDNVDPGASSRDEDKFVERPTERAEKGLSAQNSGTHAERPGQSMQLSEIGKNCGLQILPQASHGHAFGESAGAELAAVECS